MSDPKAPRLRPFFSYYGGKWRDAPRLYPEPARHVVCEPFCGSAGYSVRYPARRVILSDVDEVICALWDYLINVSESEIMGLPDVHKGETVYDLDIAPEARILVGFWLNKGVSRPRVSPSAWMLSNQETRPNTYWGAGVRERIASQLKWIRHWTITNASYKQVGDMDATWFIDPPYQGRAGSHYKHGSGGIDYEHLATWCRSRSGQVIVCESGGADWLPFSRPQSVKTSRPGRRSSEVSWQTFVTR